MRGPLRPSALLALALAAAALPGVSADIVVEQGNCPQGDRALVTVPWDFLTAETCLGENVVTCLPEVAADPVVCPEVPPEEAGVPPVSVPALPPFPPELPGTPPLPDVNDVVPDELPEVVIPEQVSCIVGNVTDPNQTLACAGQEAPETPETPAGPLLECIAENVSEPVMALGCAGVEDPTPEPPADLPAPVQCLVENQTVPEQWAGCIPGAPEPPPLPDPLGCIVGNASEPEKALACGPQVPEDPTQALGPACAAVAGARDQLAAAGVPRETLDPVCPPAPA